MLSLRNPAEGKWSEAEWWPIQTFVNKADSTTLETDQALGARGTDRVSLTNSSGTFISYPLYDAHGNEVATLAKSGSSYTTGHQRSYGAWGEVRQGDTTGGPRARYCGNLGHVQDDETGLIYMRARYYDVASGRFATQDNQQAGSNWFTYAGDQPVTTADASGEDGFDLGAFSAALERLLQIGDIFHIIDHCYTVGKWGCENPDKFSPLKAGVGLLAELAMSMITGLSIAALVTGCVALAMAGPLGWAGIAAIVIMTVMAMALYYTVELVCDQIDDQICQ